MCAVGRAHQAALRQPRQDPDRADAFGAWDAEPVEQRQRREPVRPGAQHTGHKLGWWCPKLFCKQS